MTTLVLAGAAPSVRMTSRSRPWYAVAALVALGIVIVLEMFPDWEQFRFWVEVFAGNWSSERPPAVRPLGFAISGAFAIALNLGAFLFLVEKIRELRGQIEMEDRMKYAQAFTAKEAMTKQALMDIFSDDAETISRIDEAFRKGEQSWRSHLTAIFGRRQADTFFKALDADVRQTA